MAPQSPSSRTPFLRSRRGRTGTRGRREKRIYPLTLEPSSYRGGASSPPRRRQVEDESQEGGGGLVGVEAGGGRSRAVYLRRRRRRRLVVVVVVDSLSRSILIDARLERRLFHSGLKQRAPALNERWFNCVISFGWREIVEAWHGLIGTFGGGGGEEREILWRKNRRFFFYK